MLERPLYQEIASLIDARLRCAKDNNTQWFDNHTQSLREIEKNYLPSGSGIDCGTKIDLDRSKPDKLILHTEYHHIDGESGMYDGWTEHTIIITPSLQFEFEMSISGRDRNGIKEYFHDVYRTALMDTQFRIDFTYQILSSRIPGFVLTSEWDQTGCSRTYTCHGKEFKSYRDAKLWAISEMEKLEK